MKGGKHRSPTEDRKIDVTELAVLYRPKPQPEVKEHEMTTTEEVSK